MSYADRLLEILAARGNACLVGLDPHLDLLPADFAVARDPRVERSERADAIARFCCEIVDLAAGKVPAVKLQSAFFEVFGADGAAAWERVVRAARECGLIVIGDVKRGDIASTAAAYATAFLEGAPGCDPATLCDAVTIHAFLGADSVEPFVLACERASAGIYVLVRTSNPGSADFQRHGDPELSEVVARHVARWGERVVGERGLSSVGAVVGATHARELARFQDLMPRTPLLLPGYGAQGARARDVLPLLDAREDGTPSGTLVNSSRAILFAGREPEHRGLHWKDASSRALQRMIAELARTPRS